MPISLAHSLNKVVSISRPLLFGDKLPRHCTLLGTEGGGVWLRITDPNLRSFQADQDGIAAANPNVFVPFAQIAYLLESGTPVDSVSPPPTSGARNPIESHPARKKESKTR
jgi:hypothetical protein